jgi:hypothetical protein
MCLVLTFGLTTSSFLYAIGGLGLQSMNLGVEEDIKMKIAIET